MKQTVLRHLLLMVAVAFLTGSPINAALNRIEDSSNVVQARTNVQTTTDWDDQAWREQSLFTLLSFVNEHPDQETCDKARRFLDNNPQWFIENMRTILSDKNTTKSFSELLKNNNLIVLLIADLFVQHFEYYRDSKFIWYLVYKISKVQNYQTFSEKIIIPLISQGIDTFHAIDCLLEHISDSKLGLQIARQLLKLKKIPGRLINCILEMINKQPHLFIDHFIQEDRCHLIAEAAEHRDYLYFYSNEWYEKRNENGEKKVAQYICNNFKDIMEFPDGLRFILLFFGTIFPQDLDNVFSQIIDHVDRKLSVLPQDKALALLPSLMNAVHNNTHLKSSLRLLCIEFIQSISDAVDKTNNSKLSLEHVIKLTELINNIDDTNLHTAIETFINMHIEKATRYFNSSEASFEECSAFLTILLRHQNPFNLHIDLKYLTNAFIHKMISAYEYCSPSLKHVVALGVHVFESQKKFISDPKLITVLQRISAKEYELNSQGYYTFVHGQRWSYQLVEEWFTKLWEMINSKQLDNFIFAHVKPHSTNADRQSCIRQAILQQGRIDVVFDDYRDRQLLLFMNAGLFYNTTEIGSSTAYYFCNNENVNTHIQIGLYDAFKLHRLESFYQQYQDELEQLAQEHARLSGHGNLLLIAIPQNIIHQCVYAAWPGGGKKEVAIKGIGQTQDIATILDTLRHDPEKIANFDKNEFCLVMTTDEHGGLNPESGIKFFQFNTVEPERWQAFKEKEQALFERIALDIHNAACNQPKLKHTLDEREHAFA